MVLFTAMAAMYKGYDVKARIEAARPDMQAISKKYASPGAIIVGLRDQAFAKLQIFGLAQKTKITIESTGYHPWNRSTSGVDCSDASTKLVKFHKGGLSFCELARSCTIQRIPGQVGDFYEARNMELAEASMGKLAPVQGGSLQRFSLTCCHSIQALRGGQAEVTSDDPDMSRDGKISKALLIDKDPEGFGVAFTEGFDSLEIHYEVEVHFPDIIRLIIEADNIPNSISKQDHSITLLMKVHQAAKDVLPKLRNGSLTEDAYWLLVTSMVTRSELSREAEIPSYVMFVKEWSGGMDDPFVLKELDSFVKTVSVIREIPAQVLAKLATLDLCPAIGVHWRMACMKCMISSSDNWSSGNRSTFFTQNDVQSMQSKTTKPQVLTADKHMLEAKNLLKKVGTYKHNKAIAPLYENI